MSNLIPTNRRHGEQYRAALARARRIIDRLRHDLAAVKIRAKRLRASRDLWRGRAVKSGGIRL